MKKLEDIAREMDPVNVDYIIADGDVIDEYKQYLRWIDTPLENLSKITGKEITEECRNRIADTIYNRLTKTICEFGEIHLTPANAKAGDGATICLFSDRWACTIVKVTKCTVTVRRDKATLCEEFKPEFVAGGFSAHCTNNYEQAWTYEPDENGSLYTFYWSKKYNRYGQPGNLTLRKGRTEFYDYNF